MDEQRAAAAEAAARLVVAAVDDDATDALADPAVDPRLVEVAAAAIAAKAKALRLRTVATSPPMTRRPGRSPRRAGPDWGAYDEACQQMS